MDHNIDFVLYRIGSSILYPYALCIRIALYWPSHQFTNFIAQTFADILRPTHFASELDVKTIGGCYNIHANQCSNVYILQNS